MLGIDPGLAATGFGVLAVGPGGPGVVDAGVIETSPRLPVDERLLLIYDDVGRLLDKHGPAAVVLEGLYSEYRFPRTALLMAQARGVICLAAAQRGVRVLTLAPAEVKRTIAGHGAAAKQQIQFGIQRLLHLPALPQPSHVADALALAFTGLSRAGRRPIAGSEASRRVDGQ